jgi:hypothetical protein
LIEAKREGRKDGFHTKSQRAQRKKRKKLIDYSRKAAPRTEGAPARPAGGEDKNERKGKLKISVKRRRKNTIPHTDSKIIKDKYHL